ncbi:MAG: hypothetical protein O2960_24335 [Verrucomicrobia bacterium]|nr:hypothetical protein [Verrucomicrobiota bacterium]
MTTTSTLPKNDIALQLQTVAQRLNAWRSTRRRGQRIPEDIWMAAVTLARAQGLNATAAALRLKFMTQITPQMRILVAVEPVDFRKGIDGLAALLPPGSLQRPSGWHAL